MLSVYIANLLQLLNYCIISLLVMEGKDAVCFGCKQPTADMQVSGLEG